MDKQTMVQEDVELAVDAVTIDVCLRVKMAAQNDANFEFTTSIDEVGQIVLTPLTKDVEFCSVIVCDDANVETFEQETITTEEETCTTSETTIKLKANMIAESEDISICATIDEIGQCVISPCQDENNFVTATYEQSLNLITEDVEAVDYYDYTLVNTGDGWDIKSPTGDIIEEGIATLAEAKIMVLTTELTHLKDLVEDHNNQEVIEDNKEPTEEPKNVVEAEVIVEAVVDASNKPEEYREEQIQEIIETVTENFTVEDGAVKCDTRREADLCLKILQPHYEAIRSYRDGNATVVTYDKLKTVVTEELEDTSRERIIWRFMNGDIDLFSDDKAPLKSYIHVAELDDNGYSYYYDPETDCMISYATEEHK